MLNRIIVYIIVLLFQYQLLYAQDGAVAAEVVFPSYSRKVPINELTPNFIGHNSVLAELSFYPKVSNIGLYLHGSISFPEKWNTTVNLESNLYNFEKAELTFNEMHSKLFIGYKTQNKLFKGFLVPHHKGFIGWYSSSTDYSAQTLDGQIRYWERKSKIHQFRRFIVGTGLGLDFNLSKKHREKNNFSQSGGLFLGVDVNYFTSLKSFKYINYSSFSDVNDFGSLYPDYNGELINVESETIPFDQQAMLLDNRIHFFNINFRIVFKFTTDDEVK